MLTHTVLITGTNRGLGLELVHQMLQKGYKHRPKAIIATCRKPKDATDLEALRKDNPDTLVIKELDVTKFDAFPRFVQDIQPYTAEHGLGCVINNAGVSPGLTRLTQVTAEQMESTFRANVVAPLMLVKALLPDIKNAVGKNDKCLLNQPMIVNVSSILGSIKFAKGTGGGIYPYRTSKAGLNMVTRTMAFDLAKSSINAMAIHPGWVKTDMGGPSGEVDKQASVEGILKLLSGIKDVHSGNFWDYTGKQLEW